VSLLRALTGVFVEPYVEGLEYQRRNLSFRMKGRVSSSRGFAYAYLAVTVAFVLAWFAAPVAGRTWWQTGLVGLGALLSSIQIGRLWFASLRPQRRIDQAWETMAKKETGKARTRPMRALVKLAVAVSLYHLGKPGKARHRAPANEPGDRQTDA
jgi:hypothetical protein